MNEKKEKFMKDYQFTTPEQLDYQMRILDSLFAEMVLEKSIREFRKNQIHKEIDLSLLQKNKNDFLRLVKELESIS